MISQPASLNVIKGHTVTATSQPRKVHRVIQPRANVDDGMVFPSDLWEFPEANSDNEFVAGRNDGEERHDTLRPHMDSPRSCSSFDEGDAVDLGEMNFSNSKHLLKLLSSSAPGLLREENKSNFGQIPFDLASYLGISEGLSRQGFVEASGIKVALEHAFGYARAPTGSGLRSDSTLPVNSLPVGKFVPNRNSPFARAFHSSPQDGLPPSVILLSHEEKEMFRAAEKKADTSIPSAALRLCEDSLRKGLVSASVLEASLATLARLLGRWCRVILVASRNGFCGCEGMSLCFNCGFSAFCGDLLSLMLMLFWRGEMVFLVSQRCRRRLRLFCVVLRLHMFPCLVRL